MNELQMATRKALAKFYAERDTDPRPTCVDQYTGQVDRFDGKRWRVILKGERLMWDGETS